MKKCELSKDKDTEIVETIKNIILSKHPIVENRIDILFGYPRPAMDINLNFYKKENNDDITTVVFCDGTENAKCSIPEMLTINGLISTKTVINLIDFILGDHECITNMHQNGNEIELTFAVNMKDDTMRGISCSKLKLILDFHRYPNHEELLHNYLKGIVSNFYEYLIRIKSFKREYDKYCTSVKEKIINSLTTEDLHNFVDLLTDKDLRQLLLNVPNELFAELYDDLETQKRTLNHRLIKK